MTYANTTRTIMEMIPCGLRIRLIALRMKASRSDSLPLAESERTLCWILKISIPPSTRTGRDRIATCQRSGPDPPTCLTGIVAFVNLT